MESAKNLSNRLDEYINNVASEEQKIEIDTYLNKMPFSADFSWDKSRNYYSCTKNHITNNNIKKFVYKLYGDENSVTFVSEYLLSNRSVFNKKNVIQKSVTLSASNNALSTTETEYFEGMKVSKETKTINNGKIVSIEKTKNNPKKDHIVISKVARNGLFFYGSRTAISKKDNTKLVVNYKGQLKDDSEFSLDLLNSNKTKPSVPKNKTKNISK